MRVLIYTVQSACLENMAVFFPPSLSHGVSVSLSVGLSVSVSVSASASVSVSDSVSVKFKIYS